MNNMKIFQKLLINSDKLDEVEKVSVVSIILFTILYIVMHAIFFVWFTLNDIPEMASMNIVSIIISLITIWFLIDIKRIHIGGYILIFNFCYYAIYSTYLVGYNKGATMLYPVMILLLHTLFPKQKKYLICSTVILIIGFFINMHFKYNRVALYEDALDYIDWVNYAYAFTAVFLFIYARSVAENIVTNYNTQLDKVINEANVDFLTGLYNRRFIESRFLLEELDGSYIILADIDHFKNVNDTYGHSCGDYVIKEVANILKISCSEIDDVCRWGGEEFLIYVRNGQDIDIYSAINEVRENIAKAKFKYNDKELNVTMTFGYSTIINKCEMSKNVEHADIALFHGKNTGRNKVVCYEEMEEINQTR